MEFLAVLIYKFAIICLACYMIVSYGWYWVLLLLFIVDIKSENE